MFNIEVPIPLLHVILFIFVLWIIASSMGKTGEDNE